MIDYAALTRAIVYLIGALVGAFMLVLGALRGDAALMASGLTLIGVGGTATINTSPRSGGKYADE